MQIGHAFLTSLGILQLKIEAPLGKNKKTRDNRKITSNFGTNISPIKKDLKANWEHQEIVSMVQEGKIK